MLPCDTSVEYDYTRFRSVRFFGANPYRSGLCGDTNLVSGAPPELFTRVLREKEFELKDHLGNVRVVVSDLKLNADADVDPGVVSGSSGAPPFMADMRAYNNYYPFGMLQPERHWSTEEYRYGFIGQENDNEISGTGNAQDHKFRSYDTRLGRYKSLDPLAKKLSMELSLCLC